MHLYSEPHISFLVRHRNISRLSPSHIADSSKGLSLHTAYISVLLLAFLQRQILTIHTVPNNLTAAACVLTIWVSYLSRSRDYYQHLIALWQG